MRLRAPGPKPKLGSKLSRCNALRHGLTAETVIGALEDAEDYEAFEAAITADYDAQSAVERVWRAFCGGCAEPRQWKPDCSRFKLNTIGKTASCFRIPVR